MDESILEPVELYNSQLKESLKKNAADYFDELVKKSGISINDNIETIKKLSTAKLKLEKVNKKVGKYHTYKTLLIILIIVISLIGVILLYSSIQKNLSLLIGIISFVVAIIIDILSIVCIIKKLNPAIKDESVKQKKLNEQIKSLEAEAWRQMLPLNQLYDWNMTADIIKKTTPLIQLDPFFDTKKCEYLIEKYGISENNDQNVSTINVLSGSILGNPFLIYRNYSQTWFNKTYMGSIVIHWQERYRDSDGHYRTVTRSQTLTASITRPAPSYQHNTYLIYGNDAAPTLTFSRSPSNIEGMDEKDIEKKVKSEVKKLDDKAKDAIKNNQNFVRLGNDEFEVLFGGENRNNEIEFRLLFTPLAQKNELDLIKNKTGFGDDFYFQKNGRINVIRTKHSQNQNYECNPNIFINNSYYGARNFFIDYQDQYFKSLFYDLAPLISIPLYQQYKPKEYIYQREYPSNITSFEHESLANSFPIDVLKHPASDTNVILKTKFIQKDKESDRVNICAYSFKIVHRIENVPRHGGDGRVHLVPVPYDEYIPLTKETIMEVKQEQRSRKEINDLQNNGSFSDFIQKLSGGNHFIYERGLLATLMFRDVLESDIDKWNSYFKNVNSNIQNNNNKGD